MRPSFLPLLACLMALPGAASGQTPDPPAHPPGGMAAHHPAPPGAERLRVAVLLYEHAVLLDWAIPADIFRTAGHGHVFDVSLVSITGEPVPSSLPASIPVAHSLADAPPPDLIVVPGGNWMALTERADLHAWLRKARERGATLFSVCTGAYVLAQAGLLDGREATSLHAQLDLLKELAPAATVRGDAPFVASDGVVTAAGAATAIPAALYLIEKLAGKEAADFMASEFIDFDDVLDAPAIEGDRRNDT